jgi:peptidoglycan/xylan/chitin deacetylase (PgdA/CDA1 family)
MNKLFTVLYALVLCVSATTYYNDQKQNCGDPTVRGSFCYGGPRFDAFGQYKSCSVSGVMAITFDDSPTQYTSHILDVLQTYNIKATFNVKGSNIKLFPHLVQRMANEGHQIASHTMTHPHLTNVPDVAAEMLAFEAALSRENFTGILAGMIPNYMRAPFGAVNNTVISVVRDQLGYVPVHWGFNTQDSNGISATDVVDTYYAHMGGPSGTGVDVTRLDLISQQHDTEAVTSATIENITDYLSTVFGSRGLRFVTIAECMGNNPPPYRPNPRQQTDPTCAHGIIKDGVCCEARCGTCGGNGCSLLQGGADGCCVTNILNAGYSCQISPAPCVIE